LTVLYLLRVGTAQQGWVQKTKTLIINYILRASIVSYHIIQGMSVCYNLNTETPANDACTFPVAWPAFMSNLNKLAPKVQHYTWCLWNILIQSVISWFPAAMCLRNGHAEQLLQIQENPDFTPL